MKDLETIELLEKVERLNKELAEKKIPWKKHQEKNVPTHERVLVKWGIGEYAIGEFYYSNGIYTFEDDFDIDENEYFEWCELE